MKQLRIVHVCAFDRGGAANAALRTHHDLLAAGIDSKFVVARKQGKDTTVQQVPGWLHRATWQHMSRLDYRLGRLICPHRLRYGGLSVIPSRAASFIQSLSPDVIQLHWVGASFLSIEQIGKIRQPVVWTLHDMWPLSPGYHYRIDAQEALGSFEPYLPLLPEGKFRSLGEHIFKRKLRAWQKMDSIVVAPSQWLAEEARRSPIFSNTEVLSIPYSVPLETFKPSDQLNSRRSLGLPEDRLLILFGADGGAYRKGADLFRAALPLTRDKIEGTHPKPAVVVFGRETETWLRDCGVEVIHLGTVESAPRMATIYGACDVFACPSREDNLPNTVIESLACGTPAVGFRVGGLPDLIEDGVNGFLASPFDIRELGENIARVITMPRSGPPLRVNARASAERHHTPSQSSLRYLEVYRKLLSRRSLGK